MPISNFQPIRLLDLDSSYKFWYLMANGADPDQLASSEANWSGSTLFAKPDISGFSRTWVKADLCFVRACCWWDIKTWTLTQTTTVQHSLKWIHWYIQVDDEPLLTYFTDTSRMTDLYKKSVLNPCPAEQIKMSCGAHFWFSANQITWFGLLLWLHILNDKQCKSRSVAFFRSTLFAKPGYIQVQQDKG